MNMPNLIPSQRHLFDIPDEVAYFNCAYISPLMHKVRDAGIAGVGRKSKPWLIRPADFFSDSEHCRGLFADLIGATADDIAIVPSVSYGIATAIANLTVRTGDRILVLEDQFPSNVYGWHELARERGAHIETIARPNDGDWTAAILDGLDQRIAVAALPHCHWTDGALVDLVAVGERCRDVDAAVVVDATQSLGALPFDVADVEPDFFVSASYKWLLGPYSLGFLYVAPKYQTGRPLEHNWIHRQSSEDFANLVTYRDAFQPGARRFDVGERSNFALMPMAKAAIAQILEWGVDNIQATLAAATRTIAQRAAEHGIVALPENRRAPHYLGLRFVGGVPDGLAERLAAEYVYVSVRGDSVRVTPHLYNSDHDMDRFVAVLGNAMHSA